MKFELIIYIIIGIICNMLLTTMSFLVPEVPYFLSYFLIAGFNIVFGMGLINFLYIEVPQEEEEKK